MNICSAVAERVRLLTTDKKLSLDEFIENKEYPVDEIFLASYKENGIPDILVIERICKWLGITMYHFFDTLSFDQLYFYLSIDNSLLDNHRLYNLSYISRLYDDNAKYPKFMCTKIKILLKKLCEINGFYSYGLTKILNMSHGKINAILNTPSCEISIGIVKQFCYAFNMSIEDFFAHEIFDDVMRDEFGVTLSQRLNTLISTYNTFIGGLSKISCVPLETIKEILNGQLNNPTLDIIYRLFAPFGFTFKEFFVSNPNWKFMWDMCWL